MIDWNLPPSEVSWLVSAGMLSYYEGGGYYPAGRSANIAAAIAPVIRQTGGICARSLQRLKKKNWINV